MNWNTHRFTGRMPRDAEGRDWGDASTPKETQVCQQLPEAGKEA